MVLDWWYFAAVVWVLSLYMKSSNTQIYQDLRSINKTDWWYDQMLFCSLKVTSIQGNNIQPCLIQQYTQQGNEIKISRVCSSRYWWPDHMLFWWSSYYPWDQSSSGWESSFWHQLIIRGSILRGKHWQCSSNDANRHNNVDILQHPTSSLFLKTRSMSKFSSLTDWEQHVPHGRPLRPRLGRNSSEVLPHPAARRAEEKPVDLQSKVKSSLMSLSISPFPGNSTLLMLKSTKITTKLFNNMTLHWSNPVSF